MCTRSRAVTTFTRKRYSALSFLLSGKAFYSGSYSVARSMLNKITEETFASLSSQILFFIEGCSPSIFKAVIKLIYDKAASEPKVWHHQDTTR